MERAVQGQISVIYIDYGNRATIPITDCAALPGMFAAAPKYAKEYRLACVKMPKDVSMRVVVAVRPAGTACFFVSCGEICLILYSHLQGRMYLEAALFWHLFISSSSIRYGFEFEFIA